MPRHWESNKYIGSKTQCAYKSSGQCVCVCVCVCVFVCDAQIFQIMLKLRGSTMMRRNHEFSCPSALSPGFRNWVGMTRNMQQEGVGLVFLPRPASLVRSPVLPCGGPTKRVRCAVGGRGGEKPTGTAGAHVLGGGGRGGRGGLASGSVSADPITVDTGLMKAGGPLPWFVAVCRSGSCPEDAGLNPLRQASRRGIRGGHAAPVGRRYR